jgi:hypothetical protein
MQVTIVLTNLSLPHNKNVASFLIKIRANNSQCYTQNQHLMCCGRSHDVVVWTCHFVLIEECHESFFIISILMSYTTGWQVSWELGAPRFWSIFFNLGSSSLKTWPNVAETMTSHYHFVFWGGYIFAYVAQNRTAKILVKAASR